MREGVCVYISIGLCVVVCHRFCATLKRLTSLNHLCQAARSVVHSTDITAQMLCDWSRLDLAAICKQTVYTMDKYRDRDYQMIVTRTYAVITLTWNLTSILNFTLTSTFILTLTFTLTLTFSCSVSQH